MSANPSLAVSQHFRLLGFIAAVFVVFIHGTTVKYDSALNYGYGLGAAQSILSHNMFHAALPIFFLLSSYFLFSSLVSPESDRIELRKRAISLVLPYVAWSAFWLLLVVLLLTLFGQQVWLLDRPLVWHWLVSPLPGQFWFLRDLIVLVAVSPLIRRLPRIILWILAILLLGWWLIEQSPSVLSSRHSWHFQVSNEAACWFLMGAIAARDSQRFIAWIEKGIPLWGLALLLIFWRYGFEIPLPGHIGHGLSVIAGTLFLLLSIQLLSPFSRMVRVQAVASYGFLIYLGHHPVLPMMQRALLSLQPQNVWFHAIAYIVIPIAVILLIIAFFNLINRWAPSLIFVANGGRSLMPLSSSGK